MANCIDTVLKLVKDHVSKRDEQIKAVQDVALRCTSISDLLYNASKKHYFGIHSDIRYKYGSEMYDRCCAARDIMYILGNNVDSIFSDCTELHSTAIAAWKDGITKNKDLIGYLGRRDTRNANKKIVADYEAKIQKATHAIAAEKAKKERLAKEAYWAEHAEEKANLENEKATLNKQIKALNVSLNEQVDSLLSEKQAVPGKEELDNFNARIQELNKEKDSLGIFKIKEKKALQEQIDKVEEDKKSCSKRIDNAKKEIDAKIEAIQKETNKKISALRNRIISINEELTKER